LTISVKNIFGKYNILKILNTLYFFLIYSNIYYPETPAVPAKKNSNLEVVKEDQILPGDISDMKKKSIQWSKYFGLDRRKKSYPMR
jgi:hypothetical protein